jgi:hypothetical protein
MEIAESVIDVVHSFDASFLASLANLMKPPRNILPGQFQALLISTTRLGF